LVECSIMENFTLVSDLNNTLIVKVIYDLI
jgi:hypothetical protein